MHRFFNEQKNQYTFHDRGVQSNNIDTDIIGTDDNPSAIIFKRDIDVLTNQNLTKIKTNYLLSDLIYELNKQIDILKTNSYNLKESTKIINKITKFRPVLRDNEIEMIYNFNDRILTAVNNNLKGDENIFNYNIYEPINKIYKVKITAKSLNNGAVLNIMNENNDIILNLALNEKEETFEILLNETVDINEKIIFKNYWGDIDVSYLEFYYIDTI
jgi:hypothetical protein